MTGIYKITNKITGELYIGRSVDIDRRFSEHKTPMNLTKESLIAKALKEHGKENFEFEIIEQCESHELNDREVHHISILKPSYNVSEGGLGNKGHKVSDTVRKILSSSSKMQWNRKSDEEKNNFVKNNLKGPRIGHEVSSSTREKLRNANVGKTQSLETIQRRVEKLKINLKNNKNGNKKVIQIDPKTLEQIKIYKSIKDASSDVGIHASGITSVCKGYQKTAGGYVWSYL